MVVTEDKKLETGQKEPIKVNFSLPQIAGGALAAATAAFLGSRLGVAGTIVGAAVASVVGGIGGTLYSAGIDRTHRKVTEAIQRGYEKVRIGDDPTAVTLLAPEAGDTRVLAVTDPDIADTIFRTPGEPTRVLPPVPPAAGTDTAGRRTRFWQVTLLSVGAIFMVALTTVTVVELGLGQSLDGSKGTTVSNVGQAPASASAKPTPTVTVTQTPSVTPTPTETVTVTSTPTATTEPTGPATSAADEPTPVATGMAS